MLHYCNVVINLISETTGLMIKEIGNGGDMDDDLANDLLDDMDFEGKLPMLHTMVENDSLLMNW